MPELTDLTVETRDPAPMTDWDVIERELAAMAADFVIARSERAITDDELDAASNRVGVALPDDLRFVLKRTDALYVDAREEVWPVFGGGPAWIFLRGLVVYGVGDDVPDELRLETAKREAEEEGAVDFLPCARIIADPRRYGYDANGRLIRWSPDGENEPVDATLVDALARELKELRASAVRIRTYPNR